MRKMLDEFKDFINKGDVVTVAVGLVMALYFKTIVDSIIEGIINPIIAAIFGKTNFTEIGFTINDARFSIGLVINAIISFLAVAFLLFWIIKAYNHMKARAIAEKGPEDPESPGADIVLLTEIRDELRASRGPQA